MIHLRHCSLLGLWSAVCGLLFAASFFAGCTLLAPDPEFPEAQAPVTTSPLTTSPLTTSPLTTSPVTTAPVTTASVADATATRGDRPEIINIGDSLTITFSDLPLLLPADQQQVKSDGTITLMENQTFTAAGKAPGELEKEIRSRYVPRLYPKMTVTIKPLERFFYIGGEVRAPGRQVYVGPITVLKAIQSAGDFTDFAQRKRVRLTRLNGKKETINCIKAREDSTLDPPVFPGDTIHVPRRLF